MTNKYKLLEKWSFDNGVTLLENDIIDMVSYGENYVSVGHSSFNQTISVTRKDFDSKCFPIAATIHRWINS